MRSYLDLSYSDQTLVCRDCGQQFTFTAGEHEFYASRGLTNAPGRCATCRAARKSQRGSDQGYSSSSGGDGYSSGGSSWGGESSGGGDYQRRPQREMHTIVCSSCGNEAQVPFLPTEGKPVYCSDCYRQQGGNAGGGRSGGGSRSYGSRY